MSIASRKRVERLFIRTVVQLVKHLKFNKNVTNKEQKRRSNIKAKQQQLYTENGLKKFQQIGLLKQGRQFL